MCHTRSTTYVLTDSVFVFFFSSRRRHTRFKCDWSSDVCSSDLNHDSLRTRKLLLHKKEVIRLEAMTKQKGYTLIPVRLYFRNGRVKCEIALAKGKQEWDKRATERKREADNEATAAIARSHRR